MGLMGLIGLIGSPIGLKKVLLDFFLICLGLVRGGGVWGEGVFVGAGGLRGF